MSEKPPQLERWNARYSAPGYLFGSAPNRFLAANVHRLKRGWRALAIADGDGRNGVFLAERGLSVMSVDFSPVALEKANALARERGVVLETELADLTSWHWPQAAFDAVAAIFVQFFELDERGPLFENMKHTLKPGGLVLLEGYGLGQLRFGTGGPKTPEKLYTVALLREAFADFEILELREYKTELAEGSAHLGRSAVVDLVARKR